MAPDCASDDSTTPCGVEMLKDMTPVDVGAKLRYKNPNVTAKYWVSGAHEEAHECNPSTSAITALCMSARTELENGKASTSDCESLEPIFYPFVLDGTKDK